MRTAGKASTESPVYFDLVEPDLNFPRRKPKSWVIPLAYRITRLLRFVFGVETPLRFCVNAAWLFARLGFELSCEFLGETSHSHRLAFSEQLFRKYFPSIESLVDIGCGHGRWCRTLAPYVQTTVGIDYNAGNIEIARKKTKGSDIAYVLGDVREKLPELVGGKKFDVALLVHLLEHIKDPDSLLVSLHEVAASIIVEVPDFETDPLNIVRYKLDLPYYTDADHVREYNSDILRGQVERTGWRVEHQERLRGSIIIVASSSD